MRLTIIGCSGSFPGPDSPASSYLLEADGFRLLLDLGSGAIGALQRHVGLYDIDAVCLSHLHADHCLDLCAYYVARTFHPGGPRPRIPVYAPGGTATRMAQAYGLAEPPGMTEAFEFATLAPGTRQIGPFQVTTAHMNHPVETFGFRLEHGGGASLIRPTPASRRRWSGWPAGPTCCCARPPSSTAPTCRPTCT